MEFGAGKRALSLSLSVFVLHVLSLNAQQNLASVEVPPQFTVDLETAAQLRPKLIAGSIPTGNRYEKGSIVLDRLVAQLSPSKLSWQLRIVEDGELNAYSSPDGTVYVESGLATLAGESGGLWAAILSHEVAHVVHRDWARRYLYQKSVENNAGTSIVLESPSFGLSSWMDPDKASSDLARFCREMELEADRAGLMLMARAGYHPDFVPALHHLLHAHSADREHSSAYSMHPCWRERDRELRQAYQESSIEFERRWTDWHASPGGNPPVVVFAEPPILTKTHSKEWQISVPLRCENLAGAVEVVLHERPNSAGSQSKPEIRQVTGCTSPKTTVTFLLDSTENLGKASLRSTNIYVLDSWGSVLARTDFAEYHH